MPPRWTADFSGGFPTLPGVDAHAGLMVEHELGKSGLRLQILRLDGGSAEPRLYVAVRDQAGRHARDLVVRAGRKVYRVVPSKTPEAAVLDVDAVKALRVESRAFRLAVNVRIVLPSQRRVTRTDAQVTTSTSSKQAPARSARARRGAAASEHATRRPARKARKR
jgi:hypothetical protein